MSQASPRGSFSGHAGDKSSEWPQFNANPRVPEGLALQNRNITNPTLTLLSTLDELSAVNKLIRTVSASGTTYASQHPQVLVHPSSANVPGSPRGSSPTLDSFAAATRSLPATPFGNLNGTPSHLTKTPGPGTPHTPDTHGFGSCVNSQGPLQGTDSPVNAGDLQASLLRIHSGQYENGSSPFNNMQPG